MFFTKKEVIILKELITLNDGKKILLEGAHGLKDEQLKFVIGMCGKTVQKIERR